MAITLEAFGIDRLDIYGRLELLRLIATSIPTMPAITPELVALLRERVADIEAHPDDGVPWEDVLAEWAAEDGA